MKRNAVTVIRMLGVMLISQVIAGCATNGYWTDRGRDAMDIFTASAGAGIGAKVRVGPLQTGLIVDGDLYGIRGGGFGAQHGGTNMQRTVEAELLYRSWEEYSPPGYLSRGKGINASGGPLVSIQGDLFYKEAHMHFGRHKLQYYTQIEAVVALGPSFRFGFNPGELFDFLLGWFNVDIFNDDRERMLGVLPGAPVDPEPRRVRPTEREAAIRRD